MPAASSPRARVRDVTRWRQVRRARRALPAVLAVLAASGLVAACGQGFDREAAVDSFLRANPDVDQAQAECVVDRQLDRYGLDGLAAELEADPESAQFEDDQFRDMFACGIDGDVETQLIEQLEATGVDEAEAPCVATALTGDLDDADIDVLLSGEITDAFMAKFVAAMEGCGAGGSGA